MLWPWLVVPAPTDQAAIMAASSVTGVFLDHEDERIGICFWAPHVTKCFAGERLAVDARFL